MSLRLSQLPANMSGISYGIIGFLAAAIILRVVKSTKSPNLDAFPTVGSSSSWLGSWWAAFKYAIDAPSIIREGYEKHKTMPFKVSELYYWTVILSNRQSVEELARASNEHFSFLEAIDDFVQLRFTVGPEIIDNPYHIAVVRSQLTRNLQASYPDIRDEIVTSFDDVLNLSLRGNEWTSIPALSAMEIIVCRTTNRLFVGLPLCRNPDWTNLNIQYAVDVSKGGAIVGLFPRFMRKLATRFLTNIPQNNARGVEFLRPVIEERKKYLNKYGAEWDDKPNDLLWWLMEQAEGPELTVERLTHRVLFVNVAAIHSTASLFTQVLFRLAANPQYIQPLREEVERIVEEDGWSKVALRKMRKVDSFLKECNRMEGINIVTLFRKAMKDYTFLDGTFIPKGTRIGAATMCLQYDADTYKNPEVFEPFRFVDMHERDELSAKYQFSSTSTEYLPFGHSTYACPGRFLVATELKTMLAHVVITYDVKLEDNAAAPAPWRVSTLVRADSHTKVMFRNRVY